MQARSHEAGFSLVEVLMVVLIISLSAGLVVANLPSAPRGAKADARLLAARLTLASQESVISGQTVGLTVTSEGFAFARYQGGAWRTMEGDGPFSDHDWQAGVRARLSLGEPGSGTDTTRLSADLEAAFGDTARVQPVAAEIALPGAGLQGGAAVLLSPSALPPALIAGARGTRPPALFDPTGAAEPFQIIVADEEEIYTVTVSATGTVSLTGRAIR